MGKDPYSSKDGNSLLFRAMVGIRRAEIIISYGATMD